MQEHHYYVDIEASVDELWQLFWARIPHTETGDVTIDILHPGDAVGEGLVRHCTFRVPALPADRRQGPVLGVAHRGQAEGLVEVQRSRAARCSPRPKGHTRLEDIGNGTTRVHFSESYHAFNPLLRALLEKRVHAFISKDNDRLIKESLTNGVRYLRKSKAKAQPRRRRKPTESSGTARHRPGVTVVDLWVNALTGKAAAAFMGQAGNEGIPELLGGDLSASSTCSSCSPPWTRAASTSASWRRHRGAEETEARCSPTVAAHPDRLRVALTVDRADRPVRQVTRLRALAAHPAVAAGAGHAAGPPVPAQRQALLPDLRRLRRARPAGIHQRRHPRPARALGLPAPRAPRGRPHRLQGAHGDRRPHGPPLRGAADAVHAQVARPLPVQLGLPGQVHGPRAGLLHGLEARHGPGPLRVGPPVPPDGAGVAAARDLPLSDAAAEAYLGGTAARLLHLD